MDISLLDSNFHRFYAMVIIGIRSCRPPLRRADLGEQEPNFECDSSPFLFPLFDFLLFIYFH